MPLHEAVGINCKMAQLRKIEAQVSSIRTKGCMSDNCVCVISLDMTTPPWWREKVIAYYFYYYYQKIGHRTHYG